MLCKDVRPSGNPERADSYLTEKPLFTFLPDAVRVQYQIAHGAENAYTPLAYANLVVA
jgi:hypothetical protein